MKIIFLFFIAMITVNCNSQDGNLYKINPNKFVENKITLSEIADDIFYIPLENSIPIGTTDVFEITKDNIYLRVKDIGILKFDRSGKFVCMIAHVGRGPGEFQQSLDFTIDERTGNVYVMCPGIIKVYSKSGRFIRDIIYKDYISFVGGDIEIYNYFLFIPDYLITGDSKNSWILLDTLGYLASRKENSIPSFKTNTGIEGSIYKYGNKLHYYNSFNDTIFSISPDLSYQAAYLFAPGDHRWPIGTVKTDSESWIKLFRPGKMFETRNFIVLPYAYLDKYAICLINKKTKKTYLALKYENNSTRLVKTRPSLLNDLDGGLPLTDYISFYAENIEEYIVQLIDPFTLKAYLLADESISINPKNPEKKKELEKLATSLKETDNPVLVLVRLKK